MNIKFNNGAAFEYLNGVETEEYFNGASRRTITFQCSADAIGLDQLNALLSDEANTHSITLTGDVVEVMDADGNATGETTQAVNLCDGYVLKLKCGIENRLIAAETPDAAAVYEDRLVFKLGKRTYIEEQLKRLGL